MEHLTKAGASKIVQRCSYPLTGVAVVDRIYTDLATLAVVPGGLQVIDTVEGLSHAALETLTGLPLRRPL
jgi:3-oxoadipate CoA-transferase beta subunit